MTFQVLDDSVPELAEDFELVITSLVPSDGLIGSTNVSGASVAPGRGSQTILITESDNPYGYFQFAGPGVTDPIDGEWFPPASHPFNVSV